MEARRAGSVIIIFIAILVIAWAAIYFGPRYYGANSVQSTPVQNTAAVAQSITLMHSVKGDTHSYVGEIETPTPCENLSAAVEVRYSRPPHGTIALTTEPQKDAVCAQVVTKQPFSISFMSTETPEVSLTLNGEVRQVSIAESQ